MYRIKYYRTAEDYVYNRGIVSEFEVDYTLEKIERFVEWYCSITGYIPIVERMQNGEQPFFFYCQPCIQYIPFIGSANWRSERLLYTM